AQAEMRMKNMPGLEHVVLDLERNGLPNIERLGNFARLRAHPNSASADNIVTRRARAVGPFPHGVGPPPRSKIGAGHAFGMAIHPQSPILEQQTASAKSRDRLHVVGDKQYGAPGLTDVVHLIKALLLKLGVA